MYCSLFKITLVLNSDLPFWKPMVLEFLLGTSEIFQCLSKNCPARCASAAVVCRDIDVFGTKTISLNYIL
jgi:hypothetical protein